MTDHEDSVLCMWCAEPTTAFNTRQCNACWEVVSRLERFMRSGPGRNEVLRALTRVGGDELRPPEDIGQEVMDHIQHHHCDPIKAVANAIVKDRALR